MTEAPDGLYRLAQNAVSAAVSSLWRFDVEGLDHVARSGRLIVAVNHRSWIDPPLAAIALYPRRYPRFLGKEELFRNPLAGWFLRRMGVIALDRSRADVSAVRAAVDVLEGEGCMVVFPEGTRSRTGTPGRPKPGVGFLARLSRAPVVPARVWNTERFPKPVALRIKFGPALRYEGGEERPQYQAFAERVMETIFSL